MSFISNNVNNKNFELQGSVQGSNNAAKSENVDFLFDGMIKEDTKTKEELLAENDKNAKYKLDCKLRSKNYIEGLKGKTTNAQLNYEAFKKAGAKNVTGLAFAALNKSNAVVKNASVKIQSLFNKLARILTGGETDPDKIKEKEKAVEKKIEALMKEAAAKLDILSDISQSLFKIHKLTLEMGIFNMQTHEILDFMNKMITGVNEGTDDFSDIKEEDLKPLKAMGKMNFQK